MEIHAFFHGTGVHLQELAGIGMPQEWEE